MVPGRGLLTLLGALAHTTEAFLPSDEYAATLHLTEGACVAAGAAWVAGTPALCTPPDCSFTPGDSASCGLGCTYAAEVVEACTAVPSSSVGEALAQTTCALADGVCSTVTGLGSCERTAPAPEMCSPILTVADAEASTAACLDDWRPDGCEGPRAACEQAATGNTWDMYGVRHVPCSSRQGGLCSISGGSCTAPAGTIQESCTPIDDAVCAAISPPDCRYAAGDQGSCGAGCVYTVADSGANPPVVESCQPESGFMQTACTNAGDCTYAAPDAAAGTAESCVATHKAACASVVVNGTALTMHGTVYSSQDKCEAVQGCSYTASDFFVIAADKAECEIRDSGGQWTDATAATCTRADGSSIDDPPDSTEPCVEEKVACRGTPACNSVLAEITDASLGGTSAADLSVTYGDGTDRGAEFAALVECMTPYTEVKSTFDSLGGACSWPASASAGFVQATLVLSGTTAQQTVNVPAYADDMKCRWSVACDGTDREPVVNVQRLGTEAAFDVLRVYDAASAPVNICTTVGCKNGCGEKGCASGLKGVMGYEGPYWTRTPSDCTHTPGDLSSCGTGCLYSAGDAQANPPVPDSCVEDMGAVADTGLVLEFVSDLHNSHGATDPVPGGFEFSFQCVDAVEYGCTDPAAGNYAAAANVNAAWKHGDDFCDTDTPCMGPRLQGLHEECA